jgi:hypothetical protein
LAWALQLKKHDSIRHDGLENPRPSWIDNLSRERIDSKHQTKQSQRSVRSKCFAELEALAATTAAATTETTSATTAASTAISTAATTTAAAATVSTTAAATTTATGAIFAGLGFADGNRPAFVLEAVERRDCRGGFFIAAHLHEPEPFAAAGFAVGNHFGRLHGAVLREKLFEA